MKANEQLQTQHSIAARELAEAITTSLSKVKVAPGDYSPELMAPEGPSTAGGLHSLQHLRLVPKGEGFPTLVVGSADHRTGKAELRSYGYVDQVYRERFKRPVPLDAAEYGRFLDVAKVMFQTMHLTPEVMDPPYRTLPPERPKAFVFLGIAAAACFFLGTLAFFLLRR